MQYIRGIENYNCPNHTAITLENSMVYTEAISKTNNNLKKYADEQIKSVVF